MANGELNPSSMRVLPGFDPYPGGNNFLPASTTSLSDLVLPGVYVDAVNMAAAFRRDMGHTLTYAEAYRSYGMQEQRAREHSAGGPLAAFPGTSNHGWGKSIDYRNNIGTITSPEYGWMAANAGRFGFVSDVPSEGWHWTHPSDTAVTSPSTAAASLTETPITLPEGIVMEKGTLYRNNSKTITKGKKKVANPNYGSVDLCSPLVGFRWHVPNSDYFTLLMKLKLVDTKTPVDVTDGQWKFVTSQLPKYAK